MDNQAIQQRISDNADNLIATVAKLSAHEPVEAVASLILGAACVASADGMNKRKFLQAVNIAWDQCAELRGE